MQKLQLAELSPFDHAAAGHDGVLIDADNDLVVKPCTAAEIAFYETCATSHPALNALIPTCMGTLALSTTATPGTTTGQSDMLVEPIPANIEIEDGTVKTVQVGAQGKRLDTEQAIVLENMAGSYKRPNVMDVKIGARLWADDTIEEKRRKLDKVAAETTSGSLGMRIAGMRVWHEGNKQYQVYDRHYGRQFTAENVRKGFEEFFYHGAGKEKKLSPQRREVLVRLSNEVSTIEDVLEDEETRMYSSSILLVYEGDDAALEALLRDESTHPRPWKRTKVDVEEYDDEEADEDEDEEEEEPRACGATLIDFAHASFVPGEGKDENMLEGVRNLRATLDSMLLNP